MQTASAPARCISRSVSLRPHAARGAAALRAAPPRPAAAARRFAARATATSEATTPLAPAITLTPAALEQLKKLKAESKGNELCLRIGVKSGGCSGMSYVMDFIEKSTVDAADSVIDHPEGFQIVCDPKSLLYLFGMELGYSNQLIGGGFQFQNPNAESSCGCGKSFSA